MKKNPPKILLAWDKPSFTPADEELLQQLLVKSLIQGVKTGHIADATEDDSGVTIASKIRTFVKDLAPNIGTLYFKDWKVYDTAQTIIRAVRQMTYRTNFGTRVDMLSIHPEISVAGLTEAAKICAGVGTAALLTTVLSDFPQKEYLRRFGSTPEQKVLGIIDLAHECGFHGVVCSGPVFRKVQAKNLSALGDLLLVVPGIRPRGAAKQGQIHICTPQEATALGATHLIIGGPILSQPNPLYAAEGIIGRLRPRTTS